MTNETHASKTYTPSGNVLFSAPLYAGAIRKEGQPDRHYLTVAGFVHRETRAIHVKMIYGIPSLEGTLKDQGGWVSKFRNILRFNFDESHYKGLDENWNPCTLILAKEVGEDNKVIKVESSLIIYDRQNPSEGGDDLEQDTEGTKVYRISTGTPYFWEKLRKLQNFCDTTSLWKLHKEKTQAHQDSSSQPDDFMTVVHEARKSCGATRKTARNKVKKDIAPRKVQSTHSVGTQIKVLNASPVYDARTIAAVNRVLASKKLFCFINKETGTLMLRDVVKPSLQGTTSTTVVRNSDNSKESMFDGVLDRITSSDTPEQEASAS